MSAPHLSPSEPNHPERRLSGYPAPAEEWRPVLGYEGYYEVSDLGRVRSLHSGRRRHGSILVPRKRHGYRLVMLCVDGVTRTRPIHQLVCEAFHGPRPVGHVTRHLNSVRHDNRPENLAWGTHADNSEDRRRSGYKQAARKELWNR